MKKEMKNWNGPIELSDVYLMYTFCIPFVDKNVPCAQKC